MPRKANIDPPSRLEISLPSSLRARLDLQLFSALEGRVPHGRYAEFFEQLLRSHWEQEHLELSPGVEVVGSKQAIAVLKEKLK